MKSEHHIPYFKTINALFSGDIFKLTDRSFIAEHMMIKKNIMLEIIKKIEDNKALKGNLFFEKILYAIDKKEIAGSGFSEFETYGNYVLKYYPNEYCLRGLRTLRRGSYFLDKSDINDKILKWVSKSYDIISFEEHDNYKSPYRKIFKFLKKIIPFKFYEKIDKKLLTMIKKF